MPAATRCPRCAATFAVTPAQLQAHGGWVRCGACAAVFDAPACAWDAPASGAVPAQWPSGAAASQAGSSAAVSAGKTGEPYIPLPAVLRGRDGESLPLAVSAEPPTGLASPSAPEPEPEPESESAAEPALPFLHAEPRLRAAHVSSALLDEDEADEADGDVPAPRRLTRVLLNVLITFAALALVGQTLFVFRVSIAGHLPAMRPVLEGLCQPLGCTVGYARHPARLVISASSLQTAARQPDGSTRVRLTLSLQNRHAQPQHWPALMLELRDFSDTVVLRRALRPADYATPEQRAQPLAAGSTHAASVALLVRDVTVNGYQLVPFYP